MGSSRSRGDLLMRAPAHLVSSVCVGVCRYLAFGSWPRRWRARDEGQGCEAPAKPACAERTSLTRVSRSPKLAVRSEMAHRTRTIDPVHIFTFQYPGPEPDCLTRPVSEPINLTSGRRSRRLHQHPACCGQGLRRTKPFFQSAFQAMDYLGSSTRIARTDQVLEICESV